MDRLDAMSVLLAIVETGSFSAAARRLDMPLPTVSRKIGELEAYLKTRLLHRTTRQLSLTEAGRNYVAACRRILEEISEAERAATGEYASPKGDLAVSAPVVFGRMHIVPLLSEFLRSYPEINIRLTLTDRLVHLLEEQVDVAIRIGKLPDSGLVASKVGEIRRVVCASPSYLAEHGLPRHPDELIRHASITFEGLASSSSWRFMAGTAELIVPVKTRLAVNTAEAAIAAAMEGLGLANVLSYQVAEAVSRQSLVTVLDDFAPMAWPVSVVHAGQSPQPLKLRAFLDFLTPRLRQRMRRSAGQSSP